MTKGRIEITNSMKAQSTMNFPLLSNRNIASGWFSQQSGLFCPDVTDHPGWDGMTTGKRM